MAYLNPTAGKIRENDPMSTLNGRGLLQVTAHTTNATLTAEDTGTWHSNAGASGNITISLPAASAANVGVRYGFTLAAAQQLRIDPNGTETISLPSTGAPSGAGKYIVADAVGENVEIACLAVGNWSVLSYTGTWTAET